MVEVTFQFWASTTQSQVEEATIREFSRYGTVDYLYVQEGPVNVWTCWVGFTAAEAYPAGFPAWLIGGIIGAIVGFLGGQQVAGVGSIVTTILPLVLVIAMFSFIKPITKEVVSESKAYK